MNPSKQVLAKDAEARNERERLSKFKSQVTSLSANLEQDRVQNAADKVSMEGLKSALSLQKTTHQRRTLSCIKKREKLVTDKAAIDAEIWQ